MIVKSGVNARFFFYLQVFIEKYLIMKITEKELLNIISESVEEVLGMTGRDRRIGQRIAKNAGDMQNMAIQGNAKHDLEGNYNSKYWYGDAVEGAIQRIFKNMAGGDNMMRYDAIYINKQIDNLIGKVKADISQLNFAKGYLNKIIQGSNFVSAGHKSKGIMNRDSVAQRTATTQANRQAATPTGYKYARYKNSGGLTPYQSRLRPANQLNPGAGWIGSMNEGIFDAFKIKKAERVFANYRSIKDPAQAQNALQSIMFLLQYNQNLLAKLQQARQNNMESNRINPVYGNAPANAEITPQQQYKQIDEAVAKAMKKILK